MRSGRDTDSLHTSTHCPVEFDTSSNLCYLWNKGWSDSYLLASLWTDFINISNDTANVWLLWIQMTELTEMGTFKNICLCFFFCFVLKKKTGTGLIYLHLQKVVELLTRGWKGLRSAELKVPQLVLCSERKKTTRTAKGPGREESFYPYQNLHSRSILFLLCIISYILSTWKHRENHSIRE